METMGEDGIDGEDEDEGLSGMMQSTRTRMESMRGTSSRKRWDNGDQQPSVAFAMEMMRMSGCVLTVGTQVLISPHE